MEVSLVDINECNNVEDNNCHEMLSVQTQMVTLHVDVRMNIQEME